jgi:hypothetical protein
MNSRQKIEAAFSNAGTTEFPVVVPYERILIRDHYQEFSLPWHFAQSSDIDEVFQYRCETIEKLDQDWFQLWAIPAKAERTAFKLEVYGHDVFRIDLKTGVRIKLHEPVAGGSQALNAELPAPQKRTDIDSAIPVSEQFDAADILSDGQGELAMRLVARYAASKIPVFFLSSPLWSCFNLWGFENTLLLAGSRPDLLEYACRRKLVLAKRLVAQAAALCAGCIWIEECFTECLSPRQYRDLNLQVLQDLTKYISSFNLKSVYYYCGDPHDRFDLLLQSGADALAFEESKKNFNIAIEYVVANTTPHSAALCKKAAVC